MKLYVTVEEFLYAKKIENQTERTLRGYKNALNLFANWLQKEWTIDELEKIRVIHLKQYVAYHLKMGHKATYVNGIIKILRAFFKYTNGEDYTDIAYEKVAWVREEKPVIKAFSAQDARQLLEYYDNKSYLSCRNRTIITMFLETGIRCKELIDMQPEDIKENYILIHGKNHKERLVPITSYLGKQLAKYRVRIEHQFELKSPDNNFFLSVKAKKLTNSAIERLIKIAGQGIQDTHRRVLLFALVGLFSPPSLGVVGIGVPVPAKSVQSSRSTIWMSCQPMKMMKSNSSSVGLVIVQPYFSCWSMCKP